jgi:hypothetical protein
MAILTVEATPILRLRLRLRLRRNRTLALIFSNQIPKRKLFARHRLIYLHHSKTLYTFEETG